MEVVTPEMAAGAQPKTAGAIHLQQSVESSPSTPTGVQQATELDTAMESLLWTRLEMVERLKLELQ